MQINNGLFLDATEPHHWEGRMVNDGKISGYPTNARFGSALVANTCPVTGMKWIPILAEKNINRGEEIFVNYRWSKSRWPKGSHVVVNPRTLQPIDVMVHEQFDQFVKKAAQTCVRILMQYFDVEDTDLDQTSVAKRKIDDPDLAKPSKRSRRSDRTSTVSLTPPEASVVNTVFVSQIP